MTCVIHSHVKFVTHLCVEFVIHLRLGFITNHKQTRVIWGIENRV